MITRRFAPRSLPATAVGSLDDPLLKTRRRAEEHGPEDGAFNEL